MINESEGGELKVKKNALRSIMPEVSSPLCQLITSRRLVLIVRIILRTLPTCGYFLDIGCGDGTLLLNVYAEEKVAIDLNTTYVERIKDRINFVKADATHLPFKPNTFDLITATEVLEHLEHPFACVEEIKQIIKKGGYFLSSVPNDPLWILGQFFLLRWKSIRWTLREHYDLSKCLVSWLGKPVSNSSFPLPLWLNKIILWRVEK